MAERDIGAAKVINLSNGQFEVVRVSGRVVDVLEIMELHGEEGGSFYVEFLVNQLTETGDLTAIEDLERLLRTAETLEESARFDNGYRTNGGAA